MQPTKLYGKFRTSLRSVCHLVHRNRAAKCRIFLLFSLFTGLASPLAFAQGPSLSDLNPLSTTSPGVHLYSVYGYTGYFSTPMAYTGGIASVPLSSTMGYGAGASVGWNYLREGSGISITYSPSYNGFVQYPKLNAVNHALTITTHKRQKVGTKWQTNFSLVAAYTTLTQFLFNQNGLANIVATPSTFDDLANGIVSGQYSNDQIAALLTGASLPSSPAEIALFGDRAFTAGAQMSVSYAYSTRLSFNASISGNRFQALPGNNSGNVPYLFNSSTTATGTLGMSYSLSPRMQIGVQASSSRIFSPFEDMYMTSGTLTFGRILSQRWFTQLHAGVSTLTPVGRSGQINEGPQAVGGGGLGFKTLSNTFMLSYERMQADAYGFGAESTSGANAAWNWRAGGGWSASMSAGYLQMTGSSLGRATSWVGRANLSHMLTSQIGLNFGFSYMSEKGRFAAALPYSDMYGATVSVFWAPGGAARRKMN